MNDQINRKTSPSPQCRLLTLRDASRYLSLSIPTIRNLIADGKLSVVRSSSRSKLLVDIRELEAYIQRNTQSNDAREEVSNNE